jgi:hypothetical protein
MGGSVGFTLEQEGVCLTMRWRPVRIRDVQLRSQRRLEFVSLQETFASRIKVANREPGHRVTVAIVASRGPGR